MIVAACSPLSLSVSLSLSGFTCLHHLNTPSPPPPPPPLPFCKVTIPAVEEHDGVSKFCVCVRWESSTGQAFVWRVRRRYKAFDALWGDLAEMLDRRHLPALPPKTWFRDYSAGFLEKRRVLLEDWLALCVRIPVLANSDALTNFLGVHKMIPTLSDQFLPQVRNLRCRCLGFFPFRLASFRNHGRLHPAQPLEKSTLPHIEEDLLQVGVLPASHVMACVRA